MFFPISHSHINPVYLVVVGFVIGILGGFFGVGGSFIAGPALRLMGVDWNYAVGTDLAHIVGKSIVAARKHRTLGNVDLKLGMIMATGHHRRRRRRRTTDPGTQARRQREYRRQLGRHCCVYQHLGFHALGEPRNIEVTQGPIASNGLGAKAAASKADHSAFGPVTKKIQGMKIWPMISLPTSGIRISLWTILAVAVVGGFFSGFLGGARATSGCRQWFMCSEFPLTSPWEQIFLRS